MQVSNQKPAVLSPVYTSVIAGDMKPQDYIKETLATPLFTPLIPAAPVTMTGSGNTPITDDDIVSHVINCCGDNINPSAEAAAKEIFSKTLVYFDKNTPLSMQSLFSIQAAVKEKLPFPTPVCVYTPAIDVIPASKEFLAGQCDYEKFFACLAFYAKPNTLGFYFANDAAFDAFKTWFAAQVLVINATLPANTNQLCTDFNALKLDNLTESLILRNHDGENNEEASFARVLISYLMQYTKSVSSAEFGVLPFALGELYCPKTIVFVNVERHARATAKMVADEWNLINNSLNMKVNVVSNRKLSRLTATARTLSKIAANAAMANSSGSGIQRAANIRFSKTEPTSVDLARIIKKVMDKMAFVAKSENIYKATKMTFAKPNRRDPDDFNKMGKSVSTKYKPDIHLYIDTSGSISERNYQDAVKACIKMAKKLNVNLYFNSFSHCMSQCTHLNTKDRSLSQIYAEFQRVPKVHGGTDYEQIWHYINKSPKRRREISIIMTDFEWTPPNRFVKHPKNLYYIPCSHMNWNSITRYAQDFCKSMMHIDPMCRKRLLF